MNPEEELQKHINRYLRYERLSDYNAIQKIFEDGYKLKITDFGSIRKAQDVELYNLLSNQFKKTASSLELEEFKDYEKLHEHLDNYRNGYADYHYQEIEKILKNGYKLNSTDFRFVTDPELFDMMIKYFPKNRRADYAELSKYITSRPSLGYQRPYWENLISSTIMSTTNGVTNGVTEVSEIIVRQAYD